MSSIGGREEGEIGDALREEDDGVVGGEVLTKIEGEERRLCFVEGDGGEVAWDCAEIGVILMACPFSFWRGLSCQIFLKGILLREPPKVCVVEDPEAVPEEVPEEVMRNDPLGESTHDLEGDVELEDEFLLFPTASFHELFKEPNLKGDEEGEGPSPALISFLLLEELNVCQSCSYDVGVMGGV
jgi:hypothetical protein